MKPLPWSSSSLETFKNCPEQFRARYVTKEVRDVETEHKDWGNIVHKDFERYLDGAADLPPSLLDHKPYVDRIKEWDGILFTELEAILSRQLEPLSSYRDKDKWWGGKIDVLKVRQNGPNALVVDWKTGKPHEKFSQLAMYAIYVFILFPNVDIVDARFYWLQTSQHTRRVWRRDETDQLWAMLMPDLKQMAQAFKTETWQKRPSGLCSGFCPVQTCEHWKPRKVWKR